MVGYGSDGIYWGHGKPSYKHENSGPNSCWNWEVQTVLSRKCTNEVNEFLRSERSDADEDRMVLCFVETASRSHDVCTRELTAYRNGTISIENVKGCARKEFGLAMRNLVQTSIAVGECRPIP
jgi:hypothetical protein